VNKISRLFLIIFFPFLPFWGWFFFSFSKIPFGAFLFFLSLPIVFLLLLSPKIKFPGYLLFFISFTFYHLLSSYIIDPKPSLAYWIKFILRDDNVLACLLFFIIENTHFDEKFIRRMNRSILFIVLVSLMVSFIQVRYPSFFVSPVIAQDPENVYFSQNRISSIYSWLRSNSLGITFPILVAILLSFYSNKKMILLLIVISGIVVSFLTKARYIMLSAIIVFSQLLFTSKIKLRNKIYIFLIFTGSVFILPVVAKAIGYDIQQVIDDRILEKETDMGSAKARILSFSVFLKVFPDHPIFGVGPETKWEVVQLLRGAAPIIHVGYLSYLYYYGLAGSFLFFVSLFLLLKRAWIVGKKHEFWGGFYGLLAFSFANATMVYFNFSETGIILLVVYLRYFNEQSLVKLPKLKI